MTTTPELNAQIVGLLREPKLGTLSDGWRMAYAAQRIEELEAEVAQLKPSAESFDTLAGFVKQENGIDAVDVLLNTVAENKRLKEEVARLNAACTRAAEALEEEIDNLQAQDLSAGAASLTMIRDIVSCAPWTLSAEAALATLRAAVAPFVTAFRQIDSEWADQDTISEIACELLVANARELVRERERRKERLTLGRWPAGFT